MFSSQLIVSFTEIKNAQKIAGVRTEEMSCCRHAEFNMPTYLLNIPENRDLVDLEFRIEMGIGDIDFGLGSALIVTVALGEGRGKPVTGPCLSHRLTLGYYIYVFQGPY